MPNLEGECICWTETVVYMLVDVKRALFYGKARREMYVELPPECGAEPGKVGKLLQSIHGTREAGANWGFTITDEFLKLEFEQGHSTPCIYWHK